MIRFFVAGVPKAMSVGSFFKFKRAGVQHQMQGRRNTDWATMVGQIAREHMPAAPLDGPIIFMATFYVPKPQALAKKHGLAAMPIKRPDLDNLVHKLTDKLNGVYWLDDSQVTDMLIRKRYPLDGRTGVEIVVAPVTNDRVRLEIEQQVIDLEDART